ncbi:SAM-dependent methyltransferase [uncultured Paludibacter sp.]|uniref:SAM-dependent methyltransferase n=1 Tax=uncultured Paludibacter sp. TaxID=497635 RepID=A0A653AFI3_9BACT|nr:SAM-dependent methyltransferase [uncultured Paludibacter sp.]
MIIVQLKPKKEESLRRFHPWVFSGAIQKIHGKPEEGDLVEVQDVNKNFLGIGHYQVGSIAVRIVSFNNENINNDFWKNKICQAYEVRCTLGLVNPQNNTYRLVHGEGDNLPGLIVDVYDDTAVIQAHSVGMHHIRETIAKSIVDVVPAVKNVFYKSETTLPYYAPIQPKDDYLIGSESKNFKAIENGLQFQVDWLRGQKTGFFVDQRENRALLEKYSEGKNVLNMFCYTGGFSVYALRGGANLVHSVDSSAKAVELTDKNVKINFPDENRHQSFAEDAFKFLAEKRAEYDLIILDPPAFAKHRDAVRNALKGYKRLNAKALEQIKPNSILFTFSCSQVISKEQFRLAVFSAAAEVKRNVRILHQLTQPADHPINIYHPEGEYLKGLVLFVE